MALGNMEKVSRLGWLDAGRERALAAAHVARLNLRQPLSKRVEPAANAVLVAAALRAAGRLVGSGHWHCSISGRALGTGWSLSLARTLVWDFPLSRKSGSFAGRGEPRKMRDENGYARHWEDWSQP